MPERPKSATDWGRLSGLGIELAAAVAGLSLFGYWLDRHFGTRWGVIVGGTIGVVGGLYNLIRQSLLAVKAADRESRRTDGDDRR